MTWKQNLRIYGPGYTWLACGLASSLAYAYPHTYGIEKFKEKIVERSEGNPVEVDSEIQELAKEIRQYFRWQKTFLHYGEDFDFIQTTQPLDFTQRGSVSAKWGAAIGVPMLFTTSSLQAAKENPVAVLQKYNINVNEAEGQNILELFNLSPAAKKFALAKEMCSADTLRLYNNFLIINVAFIGTYVIGRSLSNLLSFVLPFPGALILSFLSVIPAVGYVSVKLYDWYSCGLMSKADKKAALMDQSVAAGGIEYYTTLIARKHALEQVQKEHTSDADTGSVFDMKWRKKELSLEERKLHLEEKFGDKNTVTDTNV